MLIAYVLSSLFSPLLGVLVLLISPLFERVLSLSQRRRDLHLMVVCLTRHLRVMWKTLRLMPRRQCRITLSVLWA